MSSLRIAEILAARLCHDLSSPLGGLETTLELALEPANPGDHAEAMAAAHHNARHLIQRLRLLRAAWAADPGPLAVAALDDLVAGLPNRHRLTLHLAGLDPELILPPLAGRVILNMLIVAAAALPMGGTIALAGDAAQEISLTIAGPRAAWPIALAAFLADPAASWTDVSPASLPALLAALFAAEAGLRLRLPPDKALPARLVLNLD